MSTYGAFVNADNGNISADFAINPLYDPDHPEKLWFGAGPVACLYDPIAARFLVVMSGGQSTTTNIYGAFVDRSSPGPDAWFNITDFTTGYGVTDRTTAAYDSINHRFMIALGAAETGAIVKILDANGNTLTTNTLDPLHSLGLKSSAFDPVNGRFLVLWRPDDTSHGALLNSDGSYNSPVTVAGGSGLPGFDNLRVTFDQTNRRYLAVGYQYKYGYSMFGQQFNLDGSRFGDWFPIPSGGSWPDLASGPNGKSLVIWFESSPLSSLDVFGRIVTIGPPAAQ